MIMFFSFLNLLKGYFFNLPSFIVYQVHDRLVYFYKRQFRTFTGWGIHLYTGKFGQGKTSLLAMDVYDLCVKYPQLTVLTNINFNLPTGTTILPLHTADDIKNAPTDCLVVIDEIGTIFNSRDFSKNSGVPKFLFQHLCQCRKRRMMILATVQRFNLLDKQIRDITATVTACHTVASHPFSRMIVYKKFDIDEYEAFCNNYLYTPVPFASGVRIQSDFARQLYDTSELVENMLDKKYISDSEVLANRGEAQTSYTSLDKSQKKSIRKRNLF